MSGHTIFPRSLFGGIGRGIRAQPSPMKQVTSPPAQLADASTAQSMAQQAHQVNAQAKVAASGSASDWITEVFLNSFLMRANYPNPRQSTRSTPQSPR